MSESKNALQSLPLLVFEYAADQVSSGRQVDAGASETTGMLMYSLLEQGMYTGDRPEIMAAADNTCFSTPQGWLLVIGEVSEAWLWHPLTGETITLPPIHDDHYVPVSCNCLLTHNSVSDPDCAVVLLDVTDPNIWFCKVSGGQWGHHAYNGFTVAGEFPPPVTSKDEDFVIGNVAALGGKVHFTCTESNQEKMCVIDLIFPTATGGGHPTAVLHKYDVPKLEFPQEEDMCSGKVWLVESRDELLAVCVFFLDFDPDRIGAVHIFKMDLDQKKIPVGWSRVRHLGDRALLLSGTNMATWCPSTSQGSGLIKGNAVYFLKNFRTHDGDMCVYDLEEQTMEIVRVHDHGEDLVLPRTEPYWINVPPC